MKNGFRWWQRQHRALTFLLLAFPTLLFSTNCHGTNTQTGSATPTGSGTMITKPIQIQSVDVLVAESNPPQVTVNVSGIIPDSCTKAREPEVSHQGSTFTITIIGEKPSGVACAQVVSPYTKSISLGAVQPGTYTVVVNNLKKQFTVS